MMNRMMVSPKICSKCRLPRNFICLAPDCVSTDALCAHCAKRQHPHLHHLLSLPKFVDHLRTIVQDTQKEETSPFSLTDVIKAKKQEIESQQLGLIELLIKKLAQEKKKLFQALDSIERAFSEKAFLLKQRHQSTHQLLTYLAPFAENTQNILLKLQTASPWGIARLKHHLYELQNLRSLARSRENKALTQRVSKEIGESVNHSLFTEVKECLRGKGQQQLFFGAQPPVRRFSLKGRGGRPLSSGESKSRSLECVRGGESQSNIIY